MHRRRFIRASVATVGGATILHSVGAESTGRPEADRANTGPTFPSYELPRYSDWIPAEGYEDPETGVVFTHIDWETLDQLESGADSEMPGVDGTVPEPPPIVGLPLAGAIVTPLALFGILLYPFAEDVLPEEGRAVEGIETAATTWTDDVLVFHGTYSPDVFAEQYADGFEAVEERNGYTLYVGGDLFTEGQAYAVSEETLVVGMHPAGGADSTPEERVRAALDRTIEESGRVVDTDDGRWLFETTGEAQLGFGGWQIDDLLGAIERETEEDETAEAEPDLAADNPIFDDVTSVVNNLVFTPENGEIRDLEARFSGLYPDAAVPSEDEVREFLIGRPEIPHEIGIDGNRVHATASFVEGPFV